MDFDAYLDRLGLSGGSLPPTRETLCRLQEAHLLNIPFENLDVVWKRHIQLDEQRLFDKVVRRKRGGFCYELNGLMMTLLKKLGFEAHLMAASVAKVEGGYGLDAAHACIFVALDTPMLMEVGFGESTMLPMELTQDLIQHDGRVAYRLQRRGDFWVLQSQVGLHGVWYDRYRFAEQAWSLSAFQAMCDYQQTSKESQFTQRTVCSIATKTGRTTLTKDRLILTEGDRREEVHIPDQARFAECLKKIFGIVEPSA